MLKGDLDGSSKYEIREQSGRKMGKKTSIKCDTVLLSCVTTEFLWEHATVSPAFSLL